MSELWISSENDIKLGAKGIEDILQCFTIILQTIQGTVVLDRELGLSSKVIDNPLTDLSTLYKDVFESVAKYESRIELKRIKIEKDNLNGKAIVKALIDIKE